MTKEYVKNYKKDMEDINSHLSSIAGIVNVFPESSWKKSLVTSVVNFDKKVQSFLNTTTCLTTEQKDYITRIKKGEIPTFSASTKTGVDSIPNNEQQTSKNVSSKRKH
jgi:hypothetical protein